MCTRFYADIDKELKPIITAAQQAKFAQQMMVELARPLSMCGEIRPTDIAAVIAPAKNGKRAVFPMQWGFTVKGLSSPIVNARLESAADKPLFCDSWRNRRCVIPASWYYEWQHFITPDGKTKTGDKYAIQPRNSDVTWLAGLYRFEETDGFRYPVFVVLTRATADAVKDIHDRMPLILPETSIDRWISPDGDPEKTASTAITDLIAEKA
ncbi:MAG: SOS response-associated peptidase family protein [Ruminiclostridium sp.]|nr:SOS response-associated peptidase family protein [Ruminiclostridium sp.]